MIRVDQGGELARSAEWRTVVLAKHRYVVEPTGADSPSQNGQAERYNESIATTTRALLYGADLTARYWSAAAVHAVYLMNRRPHSAINKTPYEAWWDAKPDLSALKVFGSRVCVKVSGKRRAKLNRHDFTGIFLGYTAMDDNMRSNVFHLVWTYTIKELDKRKKARCACDGSTRGGKVRVLDHTYANCVDHTTSRMFYAILAAENMLIFGADVCDAFSEAPAPKQGFYIQPGRTFCEWWVYLGDPPIKEGYVIPVKRAMQGHPESPRLWEKWCDKMIQHHQFKPTMHEPCLYKGVWHGKTCYFKRQVDDFEFATSSITLATSFYDAIEDHLTMPIKRQGLVSLFNGVDVLQTRHYIKLSAETYIEKMGAKYLDMWHKEVQMMAERPLPIPTNESFLKAFNGDIGNPDETVQKELQQCFKFGYRSGVGELIYAMVTCRPDISTVMVKCAQHSV
eukprot:CCRYP_007032-RA/>CCRYP_007032-RA protein AED:0.39 eAED:0.39 QI:0/0/0/0.5/1/1/2/0/451